MNVVWRDEDLDKGSKNGEEIDFRDVVQVVYVLLGDQNIFI